MIRIHPVNENPGGSDLKRQQASVMRTCFGRGASGARSGPPAVCSIHRRDGDTVRKARLETSLWPGAPNAGARVPSLVREPDPTCHG